MGISIVKTCCRHVLGLGMVAVLAGCSHAGVHDAAGRPIADVYGAFMKGEVRLRCGLGCAAAWGAESKTWTALYKNRLWGDLAMRVADVNFQGDIQYFYLGRAAEGEGFYQAASIYYRLSRTVAFKCSGDSCNGVNVPMEVAAGLARLAQAEPAPLVEGDTRNLVY
ncbi:hypothetical protein [Pseudomonas putida]